jgi:hypothetical protein
VARFGSIAGVHLTPALRWIRGLFLCIATFFLISAVSFWVHGDQSRLRDRVKDGLPAIETGEASGQPWVDCVVLSGIVAPAAGLVDYIGSPGTLSDEPCPSLHDMLLTGDTTGLGPYDRYWFGSIYLTTIGLAVFDLATLQLVNKALLILSIASFGLAGYLRLGQDLRLAPVIVAAGLLAGLGIGKFGGDVGSAAAYHLPIFALAGFLALSQGPGDAGKAAWLGGIVGALSGYYDTLSGGIPFALSLCILTYFLLWQNQVGATRSLRELIAEFAIVSIAFFLSVVALVALKLFFAAIILGHPHAVAQFKGQLLWRTSADGLGGTRLSAAATVFAKLLGKAPAAFLFGWYGALFTYVLGAVSWIAALLGAMHRYASSRDAAGAARFIGPLLAAGVVPAWFILFLSHGFIHASFMTRVVCLVPTFGIAAAWMVFAQTRRTPDPATAGSAGEDPASPGGDVRTRSAIGRGVSFSADP